jgi:hypothetical protein
MISALEKFEKITNNKSISYNAVAISFTEYKKKKTKR